MCTDARNYIIIPCAHARQRVSSLLSHQHENCQISISKYQSDFYVHRIEIIKNLLHCALNHLVRPTSIENTALCWAHLSTTPIAGLLMSTTYPSNMQVKIINSLMHTCFHLRTNSAAASSEWGIRSIEL